MERLYYVTHSLASVLDIRRDLVRGGIAASRIHVTGRNLAELETAEVPLNSVVEDTDIMHSASVGTLYGLLAGALCGLLLAGMDPWGTDLGAGTVIAVMASGAGLGAWLGGIRGISSHNHHLAPYLAALRDGNDYLLFVEVDDDRQARLVRETMAKMHREAEQAGHERDYSPFF